ncbi:(p)ppGpp synthase/hydrolase [Bacillus phage vB_BanS-Thrax5]|nr:(p)ppGpp synthase/hydrolase [Bacillus phage vB_BanS-Thrax5]
MANMSRLIQLQMDLMKLDYTDSLKALNHMIVTMNANNGYKRHDNSDYYMHLCDVAQDLLNHGIHDQTTITASILHDFLEDVPEATYEDVKAQYGEEVADVVLGLTKDPDIDYKTNKVALSEYLNTILKDWRMLLIKASDRKHNISTLQDATDEKKYRQAVETEEYFLPLFKEGRKRYKEYAHYLHTCKTTLYPHILTLKAHHEYRMSVEQELANNQHKIGIIMDMLQDAIMKNEDNDSYDDFVELHNSVVKLLENE